MESRLILIKSSHLRTRLGEGLYPFKDGKRCFSLLKRNRSKKINPLVVKDRFAEYICTSGQYVLLAITIFT